MLEGSLLINKLGSDGFIVIHEILYYKHLREYSSGFCNYYPIPFPNNCDQVINSKAF